MTSLQARPAAAPAAGLSAAPAATRHGRVVVTGAAGFLGWHLRARLAARTDAKVVPVGRADYELGALSAVLEDADVVVHLAGANRGQPAQVAATNVALAGRLAAALRRSGARPTVVFADSVQADTGTAYGRSKVEAAGLLADWAEAAGARFVDVLLPNLFGEHGRPHYNSFVATFCAELAAGREPQVHDPDARVDLLHAQDAAQALMDACDAPAGRRRPMGTTRTVGAVADTLRRFSREYRDADLPALGDGFERALFSTYRSYLGPVARPLPTAGRADDRGALVESVRSPGGQGQTFVSGTVPGAVRGDHFHLRKFERFLVLRGQAEIRLRRVLHDEVIRFAVDGAVPTVVDMPSLWSHAIENTGSGELLTLFWTDELLDPAAPDTYRDVVAAPAGRTS